MEVGGGGGGGGANKQKELSDLNNVNIPLFIFRLCF